MREGLIPLSHVRAKLWQVGLSDGPGNFYGVNHPINWDKWKKENKAHGRITRDWIGRAPSLGGNLYREKGILPS